MNNNGGLRRVVVTGMGIISCIGNNKDEVLGSLKEGRSGISFAPDYAELGFPVFPLMPGTKKPFPGTNGFLDATTEASRIEGSRRPSHKER